MTHSRKALSVATAALLLIAGASCADDETDPPDPSSTPTASSPLSSSPTPSTPTDATTAAATKTIGTYYEVRNALRQDPELPLKQLESIAISTELITQQTLFKRERKQGLHQTGETKVVELEVQSVNLDNSDPKAGKVPTVQIDVCFDVSGVDVLDADRKSVVTPERPDTGWIRYSVANYQWDSDPDGGWRVASSQDIERTPCAA